MTACSLAQAQPAKHWLAALLCAVLLLSGCGTLTTQQHATNAVDRQASQRFDLEGRMSASDGDRGANGQIEWRHDAVRDEVTLYTPLGQIAARLESSLHGAELLTGDGKVFHADSADALLPELLGISLPVARLAYWVQAAPPSGAEIRDVDADGRPALVIDQGWRIEYLEYHPGAAASALPRRLDVSRGDARIRLIIDQWTTQQ